MSADRTLRYSANISILFTERALLERPAAAAAAGFEYIEMWWPFAQPDPTERDVAALLDAIDSAGVQLSGLNFFAGDMPSGERGIASLPDRAEELAANLAPLRRVARATGCRQFNLLYGQRDERWAPEQQDEHAITSIVTAADAVAEVGGIVLLEPLAVGLNGEYPLTDPRQIVDLIDGPLAGAGNIGLLYDLFHIGSNGIDIVAGIDVYADHIAHVQVADAPGRGEPGSGDLPIQAALDALEQSSYRGLIGCEYKPTRRTEETLGWMESRT